MRRRLIAVLGPLIIIGAGIGSVALHRARREREAAQLAAEQERARSAERARAEFEATVAAIRRELDGDRPHHPFPPQHEEERRIREENRRQAERAARAAEAARR